MSAQLAAHSISFAYDQEVPVLCNVTLDVKSGEVLVLLGANGAGKSTLLRALAGQVHVGDGQVLLDNRPIQDWTKREIAMRVAMMPQFESTLTELTVRDVVRLGRAPHRGWWLPLTDFDEQAVDEALRAMNLRELQHRSASTLSGGQWRRMVLARALAQQASILLLDEPTSGLDLKYQYESLCQIQQLARQQNIAVVLTIHDLNLAGIYADRMALLHRGSLIALGEPTEVLSADNIQKAYEIPVNVTAHPLYKIPMILPALASVHDKFRSNDV